MNFKNNPGIRDLKEIQFLLLIMEFNSSSVKSIKINVKYMYYMTVPSKVSCIEYRANTMERPSTCNLPHKSKALPH